MQVIVSTGKLGNDERIIPRNAREVTYVSPGGPWRERGEGGGTGMAWVRVRVCVHVYSR